jgi:plastocyanin
MPTAQRIVSLVCAVAFAGLVLAACGGDEEPAATTQSEGTSSAETTASEPAATTEVDISEFKYLPETITVAAGDTVTWTNSDKAPHTATADDEAFDTGDLDLGDEGEATFDEPGSYPYYCRFHAFMRGTVEVE